MTAAKTEKYPSLNGLRAISILLVVMSHLKGEHSKIKTITKFIPVIVDGQLGVSIFFVISGFLITSLMMKEEERTRTVSLKNFYIRRILRIFPAYYFLLLVYFVLQLLNVIHINNASWLTAITYTKDFGHTDNYTQHAWSLSVEEQFYLFWPPIFLLGNKTRKNVAWFLFFIVPVIQLFLRFHSVSWILSLSLFTRVDAIATGCLIALYKNKIAQFTPPPVHTIVILKYCFGYP